MQGNETTVMNNQSICDYGKTTATVECNIDSTAKGGVGKLLSVTAKAVSAKVEVDGDAVRVQATVNCKVMLYNSAGALESYDYLSDFNTTVDGNSELLAGMSDMWATCSVLDLDSSVRGDKIVVQTLLEVAVMGIYTTAVGCICEPETGILVKTVDVEMQSANSVRDTFVIDEDYDTGVTVDKILFYDADAIITNSRVSEGRITVSGDMTATVVYLSEGVVTTKNFCLPFTEEVSCIGVCDGDKAHLFVRVSSNKIVLSGADGDNSLCLQVELMVEGFYFHVKKYCVVADMHSAQNRLQLTYNKVSYSIARGQIELSDKISGSARLQEDLPPASKVLSTVIARGVMTNAYAEDCQVTVEGLLACNVVYIDADNDIHSLLVDLPYSMQFDTDGVNNSSALYGDVSVGQLHVKIKRDSEVEVTAMLNIHLAITERTDMTCVCDYEKCEPLVANDSGISIYICQSGDDWWEVAKEINAPIDEVKRQNPDLELTCGAQVCYYRALHTD